MHVLVVWVGGHVGGIIVCVDVFKAVEGLAEAGGIIGLWFDDPGETIVLPIVVKNIEELDDGNLDEFDVVIGRRSYHRFEYVRSNGEGGGDLVRGIHGETGVRARVATVRAAAADTNAVSLG